MLQKRPAQRESVPTIASEGIRAPRTLESSRLRTLIGLLRKPKRFDDASAALGRFLQEEEHPERPRLLRTLQRGLRSTEPLLRVRAAVILFEGEALTSDELQLVKGDLTKAMRDAPSKDHSAAFLLRVGDVLESSAPGALRHASNRDAFSRVRCAALRAASPNPERFRELLRRFSGALAKSPVTGREWKTLIDVAIGARYEKIADGDNRELAARTLRHRNDPALYCASARRIVLRLADPSCAPPEDLVNQWTYLVQRSLRPELLEKAVETAGAATSELAKGTRPFPGWSAAMAVAYWALQVRPHGIAHLVPFSSDLVTVMVRHADTDLPRSVFKLCCDVLERAPLPEAATRIFAHALRETVEEREMSTRCTQLLMASLYVQFSSHDRRQILHVASTLLEILRDAAWVTNPIAGRGVGRLLKQSRVEPSRIRSVVKDLISQLGKPTRRDDDKRTAFLIGVLSRGPELPADLRGKLRQAIVPEIEKPEVVNGAGTMLAELFVQCRPPKQAIEAFTKSAVRNIVRTQGDRDPALFANVRMLERFAGMIKGADLATSLRTVERNMSGPVAIAQRTLLADLCKGMRNRLDSSGQSDQKTN